MNYLGTADADAFDRAAEILRNGGELPEGIRPLLADLLRAESVMFREMQNVVDLLNVTITQAGGGSAAIRFAKDESTGDVKLVNDNTNNAIRIARAVLNANQEAQS